MGALAGKKRDTRVWTSCGVPGNRGEHTSDALVDFRTRKNTDTGNRHHGCIPLTTANEGEHTHKSYQSPVPNPPSTTPRGPRGSICYSRVDLTLAAASPEYTLYHAPVGFTTQHPIGWASSRRILPSIRRCRASCTFMCSHGERHRLARARTLPRSQRA